MSALVGQRYISSGSVTGDTLVRTGAGVLHALIFSCNDAAPTAGTIDVRDGVAAAGGTLIFSWTLTTGVFNPTYIVLDIPFTTGLYLDFTTTADVNVIATWQAAD